MAYDTRTGQLAVWRAGSYLGSWTDPTPLTSGSYLSLRTDTADVSFDSLIVLSVVKYYYSGGQRIALRRDGTVYYLLTDQLGSTRVTTDEATGAPAAEMKYYPFGWTRYNSGGDTPPLLQKTTYRFTGQRYGPGGGGLYDYGARWYDSTIGRFIQADTIVPQPGNPQSLNRYSYTLNNPLRYTDPTGHVFIEGTGGGNSTVILAMAPCLACQPTPTPYPTATPLVGPTSTPAGPVMQAAPTWSPTPYAGPWWMSPGTSTPSGPVYTPAPGRVNVSDLYWGLVVAVMNDLPELAAKYGGITIRAAGRTYSGSEMPPLVSEGVGLLASVGPNVYANLQAGKGPGTLDFQTDLVVDVIGFGGSWVAGKAFSWAGSIGIGIITEGAGALPGAVGGYLLGSFGGSVAYDLWFGPTYVAPPVYNFLSRFH